MNQYDNPAFFAEYAKMSRSQYGLDGAGEWQQLKPMFPELKGKTVLDLGCGYGWHCKYADDRGAAAVLGIDQSARMIEEAKRRNAAEAIQCPCQPGNKAIFRPDARPSGKLSIKEFPLFFLIREESRETT